MLGQPASLYFLSGLYRRRISFTCVLRGGVVSRESTVETMAQTPSGFAEIVALFSLTGNQKAMQLRILCRDDCLIFPLTPFGCDRTRRSGNNRRECAGANYTTRIRVAFRVRCVRRGAINPSMHHRLLAWGRFGRACLLERHTAARRALRCRPKENSLWQQSSPC